uniref:photosystem I assembly protein Ycf4 n=1 Tax=Galdieria phlegrea TaxID=1389228 RepID=UPI0023D86EA6|nr:photosystem I assembly protein Ycf4 [Galdieria phlegrea]WDA99601.1 photosystem I assembly protein Ycf4 [Galdieria sulphuraria]WDA99791.1 photosystem I assembly protein Ycf4 [Galdieria phlegrea]
MFAHTKENSMKKNNDYFVENDNIIIQPILGARRLDNIFWAIITLAAGSGFFFTGLSCYLKKPIFFFVAPPDLSFIPQGILMSFYGILAILISVFLWFTIALNIGSGYNKFDKLNNSIKILRLGFPGKNRFINLEYKINDIKCIQISIKQGINPKHEIYLYTKNNNRIPLTQVSQPIPISILESEASKLARFLGVSIEDIKS